MLQADMRSFKENVEFYELRNLSTNYFLPETNNRFLEINTGYRKILSMVRYRIPFPTTSDQLFAAGQL